MLVIVSYPSCPLSLRRTKNDKTGSHESGGATASSCLECEEHGRSQKDAANSREHAHGNIRNTRFNVVLSNLLEVEVAVEPSEPAEESNHEFGEGRVDVHEELALDVLGSEATEAVIDVESVFFQASNNIPPQGGYILDFVKHNTVGLVNAE